MRCDFPSIFKVECLLIAIIENIFYRLNCRCIFVWNYVNNSLKDIFRRLFFFFFNRRRRDFFHIFRIFLLLWILDHFLLWRRFDESANRECHIESYYKYSIAVEVVIGCDDFLHLVAGCCVEIDVFGLEVLESVARDHWDFVSCASHCRLEELHE